MKMIPATPHGTNSQAEKRVFDLLRSAFNHSSSDLTAYHSLNLTQHAYKRFSEIDFLICGREGLYVIEVKGGRIACKNGIWSYTNRYGATSHSVEGPFKQAASALHGLMADLEQKVPRCAGGFTIGFAVVFPDCIWDVPGTEWNPCILADARDLNHFEKWLSNLYGYWRKKDLSRRDMDPELLKTLKGYLRPEFETAMPLHVQTARVDEQVVALTQDQMQVLDVIQANPRVLCAGGAGTGKTFLAMELAKRWASEGLRVALVCRSPCLKRFLESRFPISGLHVTLDSGLPTAMLRAGGDQFDALLVDEGQDLLTAPSIVALDHALKGGLKNGLWCFFYDINNQAGLFGPVDDAALHHLEACYPAKVPLRTNCRNTKVILEAVKTNLGADMGVRGVGEGPDIRQRLVESEKASALAIEEEIQYIIRRGGLLTGQLTLISPKPFNKSSVSLLKNEVLEQIVVLDEYAFRNFPPKKISFSEIHNFKGLENDAVIVVDLPAPGKSQQPFTQHYVAMSRARAVLSLVFLEQAKNIRSL